jgi:hypothetical protein
MGRVLRLLTPLGLLAALVLPSSALATHQDDPRTPNVAVLGESLQPGTFLLPDGQRTVSSDLAFWGDLVFQGNYDGFRIIDASDPMNPQLLSWTRCNGDQGDIVVWRNLLVRSWNTKRADARNCDGTTVPPNWEGVHVFDITNKADPRLVAAVEMPCGSHTATLAGVSNNRLIVYSNNSSSGGCTAQPGMTVDESGDFMDVLAIPLDNPAGATLLRREPLAGPTNRAPVVPPTGAPAVLMGCHDAGVFRDTVNLAICASADTTNVFDIGANARPGGSLEDPDFMYGITEPGVPDPADPRHGRWHSAALSWNGKIIILGWEPGGGSEPECEATDPPVEKSLFFYSAADGRKLGQWTLPRPQSAAENCTVHNYNVVPFADRHILVHGSYQSGTSWVDFTNPGAAFEFAWSDPPPITPVQLGGTWSSYWYNDNVWESDITTGLRGYTLNARWWPAAFDFTRLNPQTQENLLRCTARIATTPRRLRAGQRARITVRVMERGGVAAGQPVALQRVTLRGPGISVTVRTNMSGIARARGITASRAGTLRATLARQLNMAGCTATKRVLRAAVVGAPAGGRLTGSR